MSLRVRLVASDPVRRHGLTAMLAEAGHTVDADSPDVVLYDRGPGAALPVEFGRAGRRADRSHAGGAACRRAAAGGERGMARPGVARGGGWVAGARAQAGESVGFAAAAEELPLTPRETEILALIGQGMSNKAVARHLGISVHTVKFHLESLFERLGATNRAEAVAKGLLGGVIEL